MGDYYAIRSKTKRTDGSAGMEKFSTRSVTGNDAIVLIEEGGGGVPRGGGDSTLSSVRLPWWVPAGLARGTATLR
jgi:hypothetical protein